MAIRIPIITDLEDQGIKNAKIAFGNFKTAVKDAEGGLGKFRAGSKSIMDSVSANAATFAVAGGAAFVSFAAEGIKAFQDVALEAGKFAAATGLQVEDASRWREVAGDIGIGADSLQTAIGKMNTEVGKNPKLFRDLGVDLVYMDGGALDVNATFLNTIQHLKDIKDPAQRAKEGVRLLGKGWRDMAVLIEQGSGTLKASLKAVSDQQTISPAELEQARKFKATFEDLKDVFTKLTISIGQTLVPAIQKIADTVKPIAEGNVAGKSPLEWVFAFGKWNIDRSLWPLKKIAEKIVDIKDAAVGVWDWVTGNDKDQIPVFAEDMRLAREDSKQFAELIRDQMNPQIDHLAQKLVNAKTATDNARAAWSNLIGQFERQVSFDKLDTDIDTLKEKAIAAFGGGKKEMDAFHEMQLTVAQDFEKMVLNFPPELQTKISIAINSGDLAQLAWAAGTVKFLQQPIGSSGNDPSIYRRVENGSIPARASGGPVIGGQSYLVGERGPELFTPSSSGNITPNGAMGGNTITVNVNGGDPNQVVAALQRWVRDNGAIPMTTTTAIRR